MRARAKLEYWPWRETRTRHKMSQNSLLDSGDFSRCAGAVCSHVPEGCHKHVVCQFCIGFLFLPQGVVILVFTFSCRKDFGEFYVSGVDDFFYWGKMRGAYSSNEFSGL